MNLGEQAGHRAMDKVSEMDLTSLWNSLEHTLLVDLGNILRMVYETDDAERLRSLLSQAAQRLRSVQTIIQNMGTVSQQRQRYAAELSKGSAQGQAVEVSGAHSQQASMASAAAVGPGEMDASLVRASGTHRISGGGSAAPVVMVPISAMGAPSGSSQGTLIGSYPQGVVGGTSQGLQYAR